MKNFLKDILLGLGFTAAVIGIVLGALYAAQKPVRAYDSGDFELIDQGPLPDFTTAGSTSVNSTSAQYNRLRDKQTGQEIVCITTYAGWRGLSCYPTGRKW